MPVASEPPSVAPPEPTPACTPWPDPPDPGDVGLSDEELEFSDEPSVERIYWREVSRFRPAGQSYASLEEIADESHLVVVGHLVGTQLGQVQPFSVPSQIDHPYLSHFGVLEVDSVITGTPKYSGVGTILVKDLGPERSIALPSGQFLIFLQNDAELREEYDVRPSCDPADSLHYGRPNGYQAVLLIHDGVLAVIQGPEGWEEALGPFPTELDGRTLEDVAAEITAATD
jgi:hypothetical protein